MEQQIFSVCLLQNTMLENARMVRDVQNTLSLLSKHRQVLHVAEREKKTSNQEFNDNRQVTQNG